MSKVLTQDELKQLALGNEKAFLEQLVKWLAEEEPRNDQIMLLCGARWAAIQGKATPTTVS